MLAAPLLAGNDLQNMSPEILAILTNREIIAVDQDPAGKQGRRVSDSGNQQIWMKELSDSSKAVGLFNLASDSAAVSVRWTELGLNANPQHARDLWLHRDVPVEGPEYAATVPSHGVIVLRVWP